MKKNDTQDWRLELYAGQLNRKTFHLEKFVSTATNDHEHCVFCMQKITDLAIADADTEGYCTVDLKTGRSSWICKNCFDEFKERFHFKVK